MSVDPDFDAVRRPIEEARGLPAEAYTTERFLDLERRTLFSHRWICIGLVDDVPERGDATPREVAGKSVIMTRDTAGAVHVFHNYCRHRGLKILTEAVRGRSRFTCPYHAWTYALDGRLVRAPHFDGPGRHSAEPVDGLARVRSAVWHRLVFVNLSGNARDFADYIAPLERRWARYDLRTLRHAESRACDIRSNWKLAVENFIDEVFVVGDKAMAPELAPARHTLIERFQSFNVEDIAIVEGLQDAFATTAFDGGRLSPAFDANIHHFHRLIAEHTGRSRAL